MIANDTTAKVLETASGNTQYDVIVRIKPGTKASKQYRAEFADGTVTEWQSKKLMTYLDGYQVMANNGNEWAKGEVAQREENYRRHGWIK